MVQDYVRITFRGTCDPMFLLRIEIRQLMNDLVTTMGILVRLRPVLTPQMLAEWAAEFRTIWLCATHWVTGFHLGSIQPNRWQAAILAITEGNARETFLQPIFPSPLAIIYKWHLPLSNPHLPTCTMPIKKGGEKRCR